MFMQNVVGSIQQGNSCPVSIIQKVFKRQWHWCPRSTHARRVQVDKITNEHTSLSPTGGWNLKGQVR